MGGLTGLTGLAISDPSDNFSETEMRLKRRGSISDDLVVKKRQSRSNVPIGNYFFIGTILSVIRAYTVELRDGGSVSWIRGSDPAGVVIKLLSIISSCSNMSHISLHHLFQYLGCTLNSCHRLPPGRPHQTHL